MNLSTLFLFRLISPVFFLVFSLVIPAFASPPTYTGAVDPARHAGIDALPPETFGEWAVTFDYTGVRPFHQVPAVGVHPRLFFGPEELPDIRKRLAETEAGKAVSLTLERYSVLLRLGQGAYLKLPETEQQLPNGQEVFHNLGYYDRAGSYQKLVAGDSSDLSHGVLGVLAGEMSLEAFLCLVHQGEPEYDARSQQLAKAMDTWAQWGLTLPKVSADQVGGHSWPSPTI